MNDEPPVALVDMDGTICNYYERLEADVRRILGDDFEKVSPHTRRAIELVARQREGWYRELEPLPLGFEIVKILKEIGFRLMILTKGNPRTPNAYNEKVEWCVKYIPEAEITITQDKGIVYGKILVDDWVPYVTRWLEHRPRGLVLMPDQKWNRDFTHGQAARISTAKDLEVIRPTLEEIYRR